MELRHLKYFLKVAEELSFSKAAEKLFISQPPLSRQIKELEQEIGARLFNRNNKRVELTEAGIYFEKEIKEMFHSLERIKSKTKKISENISGEFRIAYISSTFSKTISKLVKYLSEIYPFVNLKLYEVATNKQIKALEQGKLDLGIIRAPAFSDKLSFTRWFSDSFSLVFNNEKFKIDKENDLGKLKEETFVFFNKDYAPNFNDSLVQICNYYGFMPNVVHESNNINSILQMVSNGLGVSIVPSSLSQNHMYSDLSFLEINQIPLYTEVLLAALIKEDSEITKNAIDFLLRTE